MKIVIPALLFGLAATAPALAQTSQETSFMKSVLKQVQALTLKAGREYCGYIGITPDGKMKATSAKRGGKDGCRANNPPDDWDIIFSYHSHGTFDEGADSETPSVDDVLADADEGVDGWVVTPGGRIWFINGRKETARQVCGRNCVKADPNFIPEVYGPVRKSYTLDQLIQREENDGG